MSKLLAAGAAVDARDLVSTQVMPSHALYSIHPHAESSNPCVAAGQDPPVLGLPGRPPGHSQAAAQPGSPGQRPGQGKGTATHVGDHQAGGSVASPDPILTPCPPRSGAPPSTWQCAWATLTAWSTSWSVAPASTHRTRWVLGLWGLPEPPAQGPLCGQEVTSLLHRKGTQLSTKLYAMATIEP